MSHLASLFVPVFIEVRGLAHIHGAFNVTSILTNTAAMAALQTLRTIGTGMAETQQQVSSGLRVETASDNAAYWSISTTMRSDNKAISAVADALGLGAAKVDVAYTAIEAVIDVLSEFKSKLIAAKEPGVDAAKIQAELDQLKGQIVSVSQSASFNGVNWLDTDIANINDSDLNKVSLTSSFIRSKDGVTIGKTDFHLSEIALFNKSSGGLLQADTRKMLTLGGIRNYDTYMDAQGIIHMDTTNTVIGVRAVKDFNFTGPLSVGAGDTISFDITVDADNPADVDAPHHPGKTMQIVIDRTMVDTLFPAANGVISSYTQYASLLNHALSQANSGASATTYVDNNGNPIINKIGIQTQENSGLNGSSVEISNFVSNVGSGGMSNSLHYGTRGSGMSLLFTPFEVHKDGDNLDGVELSFSFGVNGAPATDHGFNRTHVNQLLGKTNGKVETSDEMVTLLRSLISADWPDVIIEATGSSAISVRSDKTVDRLSGARTSIGFTGISVNIEPLAEQNVLDIDIVANPQKLDVYIGYLEVVTADVIDAGATLGALKTRIDMQENFAQTLMDSIDKGVGRLVDADMNEASTRLKALQAQEQLAIQSLQIANSDAGNILQLFR
ncbi:flagellin [Ensifer sp. KUDG1]